MVLAFEINASFFIKYYFVNKTSEISEIFAVLMSDQGNYCFCCNLFYERPTRTKQFVNLQSTFH